MIATLVKFIVVFHTLSVGYGFQGSFWGALIHKIQHQRILKGSLCTTEKNYDNIFHVTKHTNLKNILKTRKILPRAMIDTRVEQLFANCDCNSEVVYTSFVDKTPDHGTCVFKFPAKKIENLLQEQSLAHKIFITAFYNLGKFDMNFSASIENLERFISMMSLPGHELIIPSPISLTEFEIYVEKNKQNHVKNLLKTYRYHFSVNRKDTFVVFKIT